MIFYLLLCSSPDLFFFFFFLMIRRPPRSTPLSLHDALPISLREPRVAAELRLQADRGRAVDALERPADRLQRVLLLPCQPGRHAVVEQRRRPERRHHRGHRSEEHTSELQSRSDLVCRLLLEK